MTSKNNSFNEDESIRKSNYNNKSIANNYTNNHIDKYKKKNKSNGKILSINHQKNLSASSKNEMDCSLLNTKPKICDNSKYQSSYNNIRFNYNNDIKRNIKNQKSAKNITASRKFGNLLFRLNTHEIDFKEKINTHKKNTITDPSNLSFEMKKSIFNQNIDLIDKNINTNINKVKNNEIQNLNRKLNVLKANNDFIQKKIMMLRKKNSMMEKEKNIHNKTILHQIEKIMSINEVPTLIKNYGNEKLKNSLFEKLKIVFLENKGIIIGDDVDNYLNWIEEMINKIKKIEKDMVDIKIRLSKITENNIEYKNYYLTISKQFRTKTNTELKNKIIELINQNIISKKEEEKIYKLLLENK